MFIHSKSLKFLSHYFAPIFELYMVLYHSITLVIVWYPSINSAWNLIMLKYSSFSLEDRSREKSCWSFLSTKGLVWDMSRSFSKSSLFGSPIVIPMISIEPSLLSPIEDSSIDFNVVSLENSSTEAYKPSFCYFLML